MMNQVIFTLTNLILLKTGKAVFCREGDLNSLNAEVYLIVKRGYGQRCASAE